jgi:hypothetical protein
VTKLNNGDRYVYNNGYVYVVDPTTYAVTPVIDTFSHRSANEPTEGPPTPGGPFRNQIAQARSATQR